MVIKPLDPIAEIGATSAARRISQRPAAPEPVQKKQQPSGLSQLTDGKSEEQQQKSEQRPEAHAPTPARPASPSLRFHVDQDTGRTIAELVDHDGQVVRQMPTEEALEIAKAIGKFQGMFVDLKV